MFKAVMFDFGHTIIDELTDRHIPLVSRAVYLMPGVCEILPLIKYKMGIWANTIGAVGEQDIRIWLKKAGIDEYFTWIATSSDARARKPDRRFFSHALRICSLKKDEVIFVGNQLNTDIQGANDYGVECVWLSGTAFRVPDDVSNKARPTYVIGALEQLPSLLETLASKT
jgi:putative hydrolase of the HAD superfamily